MMHGKHAVRILLGRGRPGRRLGDAQPAGRPLGRPFELVQVELLSAGIERCAEGRFDVILLDLALPDSQGLETFFTMHAHAGDVPIVVLSGYDDEATAVKAVQAGRQDYLVKGQVDDNLLVRSIRYAIERSRRHRAEEALRDASEEFRAAQEIQQRLYPAEAPVLPGFDIAGACIPPRPPPATTSTTSPCSTAGWASSWAT